MPWESASLAPVAANEVRYGAFGDPRTAPASSFSNTTTRTCSGVGRPAAEDEAWDEAWDDDEEDDEEPDVAGGAGEQAARNSSRAVAAARLMTAAAAPGPPTARGRRGPRPAGCPARARRRAPPAARRRSRTA